MSNNEIKDLVSLDRIFDFFKITGYNVEEDRTSFRVSELIEKSIDGEVWTIIDQQDLTALIIRSEKFNRKSYQTKINNYLQGMVGMKIVFYTQDFSYYNLSLIYNGIYNVKFKPEDPGMGAIRVLESLENREELFDYTKEDVNIVLLERELTSKELIEAIKGNENSMVKIKFQEGGLKLIGEGKEKIIISYDDSPIPDMIVDVKLNHQLEKLKEVEIESLNTFYKQTTGRDLKLICLITKKGVLYYWNNYSVSGYINYTSRLNDNVMEDIFESLIAQVSYKTAFNSETFHQQFGTYSPFFILGINMFKRYIEEEYEKINIMYEEWKSRFSKVYQRGDLDEELFLKHSYLSLLIKTVLFSKFLSGHEDLSSQQSLEKLFEIFEERGIPIFINDFFQWSIEEKNVQSEVFVAVRDATFIVDDLFRTIYQEMVSPSTRHALGEFFTPAPLARKMVEEAYEFGQYVLDPACGSGTFLVEILNYINNENRNIEEKVEAFSKIYGFDVNPIAILVSRSNLLLLTDKLFKNLHKIPINVYLTDSLNPIDEFTPIIEDKMTMKMHKFQSFDKWHTFGEIERFNMPAINDSLVINKKFFNYTKQFGNLLKELDIYLSKNLDFDVMLNYIYNSVENSWLDELCEGQSTTTLRSNFEYIANKLYSYVENDKNHIWVYLLYNALGVRKMRETMEGVDLIIGNPPWVVLHSIYSNEYKNEIKNLAKKLDIMMGGKNASNTEISSIFCCRCKDLYLKENGLIFFVITAGIMSGDQHSKFRRFNGFGDIFIWMFDKDLFKIPSICIGMKFITQDIKSRTNIEVVKYKSEKIKNKLLLEKQKPVIYVPYNYTDLRSDDDLVKRLIPSEKLSNLLPRGKSYYYDKFYAGARLGPRILVFINIIKKTDKTFTFKPDLDIGSKKPWDFIPFKQAETELDYIFQATKSTEIVPFAILKYYNVFLPIEHKNYEYNQSQIKPSAKKHFMLLNQIYKKHQKKGASITDLWERLNYIGGLINPSQRGDLKVVYPGSGKFMKSALVRGNYIIDDKLYYYTTQDENEAYYLMGILNSNVISKDVKYRSATGFQGKGAHIHKRVLEILIPEFNQNEDLHIKIVELGKKCEKDVEKIIYKLKEKKLKHLKKRIKCKYCGNTYIKTSFEANREIHEKKCDNIDSNHNWSDDDWIDLHDITIEELELSRMKTQNAIFNDETMQENLKSLDELVKELLSSESD